MLLKPKLQCTPGCSPEGHPCTVLLSPKLQCKLGQIHRGLSWAAQLTSELQCKHGRSHEGLPCLVKAILLSQPLGPGQADHLPQVRLLLQHCPRSLPVFLLHCQLSNRLHRHEGAGEGVRGVLQQPATAHGMAAGRAVGMQQLTARQRLWQPQAACAPAQQWCTRTEQMVICKLMGAWPLLGLPREARMPPAAAAQDCLSEPTAASGTSQMD